MKKILILAALLLPLLANAAEVFDWDRSAANNNSAPPNGFPENMQYSQVNDAAREVMAVIARDYQALAAVTTAGAGNVYTLTIDQTISAYAKGMTFVVQADKTNTGAATFNVNSVGALNILTPRGDSLAAGDLTANGIYQLVHDGTQFRILALADNAASIKTKYESNADTNAYDDAAVAKLAGIEASATADQTGAEIKVAYEAEADTNAFTDADHTKLDGIESGATADQTNAEIRTAVEAATDSNVFTDADHSKLNGIEASATADQTSADIRGLSGITTTTSQEGIIELATQGEVDTGTDTVRAVTPSTLANYSGLGGSNPSVLVAFVNTQENRSSTTTLTDSTALQFNSLAVGHYALEGAILYRQNSAANQGICFDFNSTGSGFGLGSYTALLEEGQFAGRDPIEGDANSLGTDTCTSVNATTQDYLFTVMGMLEVSTNTVDFRFRFAQQTSNAANTELLVGTWLRLTRLD